MSTDKEKLQRWLDGIAGFIMWNKAYETDIETVLSTLIYHDIPGIIGYLNEPDGPENFFSPRSSGYAKYTVEQTKEELLNKFDTDC